MLLLSAQLYMFYSHTTLIVNWTIEHSSVNDVGNFLLILKSIQCDPKKADTVSQMENSLFIEINCSLLAKFWPQI